MTQNAGNPTATGPAGAHFEARVGAYYLLAMLLDAEPRGLPGSRILRIQLQGAGEGHPLDDVIVHAQSASGTSLTLEIQAKRKITFSASDTVFQDVLDQIADVVKAGRLDGSTVMGIATAQGSRQIDGAYQEVLLSARNALDASAYFARLARPVAANDAMRAFVKTVRDKLVALGAAADDASILAVLQNLHILVFDFAAVQGQSEALALDQCRQALVPAEAARASVLWSTLTDIAQTVADTGGTIDAVELRRRLVGEKQFHFAGLRQNRAAIALLADASRNALHDVRNRVADVALSRRERLDQVNASLDRGRYVSILGDAGVGKSGILRLLAEQAAMSGNVIVLSPARTPGRGWNALRRDIGFPGTAADLLNDIASSGESTLFVDSVDFFEDAQRPTINDLVRAAADIPGFRLVVTARRSFGAEEVNWLDAKALDTLGHAPPVVIDELSGSEVDELRSEAPRLTALLADGHAARDVVRNLFRLDRLVRQALGAHVPRTEAEMARIWWTTGDGANDCQARDRTRILRGLAEQSLPGFVGPLNTSGFALVQPLDALIASGSLKDMGGERMLFRHDVFRDWAVANLLHEDPTTISRLPLSHPAPASLFRGLDIAARMAIEESEGGDAWAQMLTAVGGPHVHGSWKRAVIVALVRSELSVVVLNRAEPMLLADEGALLKELIRTVMALDVMPLGELMSGKTAPADISDLTMPVGPSWGRLIRWLLSLKDRVPSALVPDLAKLYIQYASAAWPIDRLVSMLVQQLYAWLMAMDGKVVACDGPQLGGIDYDRRYIFHDYLRAGFSAFSVATPELAESYLTHLLTEDREARGSAESVVMAPGTLAQAAPDKLAELTAHILIERPHRRRGGSHLPDDTDAFSHIDSKFLSPSPARGPFLALLTAAPKIGLALIRKVVTHACTYHRSRSRVNDDAVVVEMPDGPRRFPYPESYYWSRDGNRYYSMTSALMALEAWAHQRIESGASPDDVIADILGEGEAPAAYLLVVVDVILSHFSTAWKAAIPFAANPYLLAWDRSRHTRDQMDDMGMFGDKEPKGLASRESLKKRGSRNVLLERTLPIYAFNLPPEDLAVLRKTLETAAASLDPYEPHADFGDPRFMVRYALNVTDRANYHQQEGVDGAGNKIKGFAYQSPPDEAHHLASLEQKRSTQMGDVNLRAEVALALSDASRGNVNLVARALPWARELAGQAEPQPDFDHSVVIAAYLLMRDGDEGQRLEHGSWARAQFVSALTREEDPVHRMRDTLQFNPIGVAAAGLVLSLWHTGGLSAALPLVQLAVKGDPAVARGFAVVRDKIAAIDERLPRSLLRCAFVGSVRAHLRRYDPEHAAEDTVRSRQVAEQREAAAAAEWRWLTGVGDEPPWPAFPDPELSVREPMYIGDPPANCRHQTRKESPGFYADHQAAAVWLSKFIGDDLILAPWLRQVAHEYSRWTSLLNGTGLDSEQELAREPYGWNSAYFCLVARSLTGLDAAAIDHLCLTPVIELPDKSFLDVSRNIQFSLDVVYFRDAGLSEQDALRLRRGLIDRLKQTSQWRDFVDRPGYGVTLHLDGGLSTAFMCLKDFGQPPVCYVTALGMKRAAPFLPDLIALAQATPSLFTAKAVLAVVTVSLEHPFIEFGVKAIAACMEHASHDTKFWIDYGVGAEFCAWLATVLKHSGYDCLDKAGVRAQVEKLISDLIRLGIAQASALERDIVAASMS
jgi:hypothetical protein